jgi:hypothetical protein
VSGIVSESVLIAIASLSAILWTGGLIARQVRPHKRDVDVGSGLRLLGFGIFVPILFLCFPQALRPAAVVYAILNAISALFQWLMYKASARYRVANLPEASSAFYNDLIAGARWLVVSVFLSVIVAMFPTAAVSAGVSLAAAFIGYQLLSSYLGREGEEYIEESLFQSVHAFREFLRTVRKLSTQNRDAETPPSVTEGTAPDDVDGTRR